MRLQPLSTAEHLLKLLRDGERLTQGEIAERLEISARHVRRLIDILRNRGVSVREERRGRKKEYYLAPADHRTDGLPIDFTERQMLALIVAAKVARSALRPTPLSEPLSEAIEEMVERIVPHVYTFEPEKEFSHWHFSDAPSVDLDPDVFETLVSAIDEQHSVRIDYHTASTGRFWEGRKINPLVVAAPGGSWICAAYCHEREEIRDFSLAGIETIALCDPEAERAYFDPPSEFDPERYFQGRFRALAGDEVHVVRLLVEPNRAPYFQRKQYHPTQVIEEAPEERSDGRMVVSYEVAGLKDVTAWICSWGPGVKVLAPPELAARIAAYAAATRARYDD